MTIAVMVETQYGRVEGELRGAHSVFRGIPFARPPVGALRFLAPEAPEPWRGVRPAQAFGASALQGAVFAPGVLAEGPQSEDCLYLNVYTPRADMGQRPVLFFIHGGAFTVGSASAALYDGARLAEQHDVVVVTINYRIGALGYLPLGEAGARWGAVDNRGQLDQVAALRWVQGNIAGFGGDADNVTIFGESAGATAVLLLLATPSARGLFKRAISQSAAGGLTLRTPEQAASIREAYLQALALPPEQSERLRELPTEALMRAQASVESQMRGWPHFSPVADALFGGQPRAGLLAGQGNLVPLLLGTNRDEWNLFALGNMPEWQKPLADDELIARLARKLPADVSAAAASIVAAYRSSRREHGLPHENRALLRAIEGDLRFRIPSLRFAELYQTLTPDTYVYLFTQESPALRGELGACHALELAFVFGTYDAPNQDKFVGAGDAVVSLSRTMSTCWTSFARSGEPSASLVPSWPRYESTRRQTLELRAEPRLTDDALGAERRAWDGVI
jgi:para-nitrobenzyl esterase